MEDCTPNDEVTQIKDMQFSHHTNIFIGNYFSSMHGLHMTAGEHQFTQ